MSSDITTQPAYINALVDAISAALVTAGEDVMVVSADIGMANMKPDTIIVIGVGSADESWFGVGNWAREETYVVAMGCLVARPGADETAIRAARTRVYALYQIVANLIRTTPQMGLGATVQVSQIGSSTLNQGFSELGRWAELMWSVRVQGYLEVT